MQCKEKDMTSSKGTFIVSYEVVQRHYEIIIAEMLIYYFSQGDGVRERQRAFMLKCSSDAKKDLAVKHGTLSLITELKVLILIEE